MAIIAIIWLSMNGEQLLEQFPREAEQSSSFRTIGLIDLQQAFQSPLMLYVMCLFSILSFPLYIPYFVFVVVVVVVHLILTLIGVFVLNPCQG